MKYLKMLLLVVVAVLTFGAAKAQSTPQQKHEHRKIVCHMRHARRMRHHRALRRMRHRRHMRHKRYRQTHNG